MRPDDHVACEPIAVVREAAALVRVVEDARDDAAECDRQGEEEQDDSSRRNSAHGRSLTRLAAPHRPSAHSLGCETYASVAPGIVIPGIL